MTLTLEFVFALPVVASARVVFVAAVVVVVFAAAAVAESVAVVQNFAPVAKIFHSRCSL